MDQYRSRLLIQLGDESSISSLFDGTTYLYRIESGVDIAGAIDVNDASRLHEIALECRDSYSDWIYSLNQSWLDRKLVSENLSLFLISDCSAKRTELFPTYSYLCNLLLIQEIVRKRKPDQIVFVNATPEWLPALNSICGEIPVVVHKRRGARFPGVRRLMSDLRFLSQVLIIALANQANHRGRTHPGAGRKRMYFSIYPKMIDDQGMDKKYKHNAGAPENLAVSILTDGLHQRIPLQDYFRLRTEISSKGARVFDDYLNSLDSLRGVYWSVMIRLKVACLSRRYRFSGIDLSGWLTNELKCSASRLARFMALKGCFDRFFQDSDLHQFVYYLHEYPLGRLISWVLSTKHPVVEKIGFQHGPCAWRKMVYSLSKNEVAESMDFRRHVAIPDRVLAEDEASASIYRYSGYKNVEVMGRVSRLDYLESMALESDPDILLVAPGLNDGPAVLKAVWRDLTESADHKWLIKPHPLANNRYLDETRLPEHVRITNLPIQRLLPRLRRLYVSYSSLGAEAMRLGIPISLVDVPGQINESPLKDLPVSEYSDALNS